MSDLIFSLWDIITILGYPLVAWLAYRGGQLSGIHDTVTALQDAGVLGVEEEEDEE
jgi:hypothetical protein